MPRKFNFPSLEAEKFIPSKDSRKIDPLLDLLSETRHECFQMARTVNFNSQDGKKARLAHETRFCAELAKVIKEIFNLKVLVIAPEQYFNWSVSVPRIGKESVMDVKYIESVYRQEIDDPEIEARKLERWRKNRDKLVKNAGTVDFVRQRVGGAYAEMESIILVNAVELIAHFEVDEYASFIIHEIGHIFDFFSSLHRTRSTLNSLHELAEAQLEAPANERPKVMRYKLVEMTSTGQLPRGAITKHTEDDSETDVHILMERLNEITHKAAFSPYEDVASDTQFCRYHEITPEQNADAFVSKVGMGMSMLRGLSRIHGIGKNTKFITGLLPEEVRYEVYGKVTALKTLSVMLAGTTALSFLSSGIAGGAVIVVVMASAVLAGIGYLSATILGVMQHSKYSENMNKYFVYDNAHDRIGRILENEVRALVDLHKSKRLDKANLRSRIRDIRHHIEFHKSIDVEQGPNEKLLNVISGKNRRLAAKGKLRNDMEAIAANPLYVSALEILYSE